MHTPRVVVVGGAHPRTSDAALARLVQHAQALGDVGRIQRPAWQEGGRGKAFYVALACASLA